MEGERNLAPERGPSVWNRVGWKGEGEPANRWLQGVGGAAIALTGAALAAVGGSMVYRAACCRGAAHAEAAEAEPVPQQARSLEDVVGNESNESFPASDAPSWTPTMGAVTDPKR